MGVKADIQAGLAARLAKIGPGNGYTTDTVTVYYNEIPFGLELEDDKLPAILIIAGDDIPEMKQGCYYGHWLFELQLWHRRVDDSVMDQFVRDVNKVIYADDPVAQRNDAWRGPAPTGIHESVYDIRPLKFETDLNMIEANRLYLAHYEINFTSFLYNL
jgi:hypothetical protein